MIATCTVRSIQSKLEEKEVNVSIGSILAFCPFFITFETEKEIALCLCKLCLNTRMMFEPLMKQAKKDGDEFFSSITEFFMSSCQCYKSTNGFLSWQCVSGKCKKCKNLKLPSFACENSSQLVTTDQYKCVESKYKKMDKKSRKEVEKTSTRAERVSDSVAFKKLYPKLVAIKKVYLMHRYQVNNDVYQWPLFLATIQTHGSIFHMDFSENLTQMFKYEPQSAHFSKKQFSLHCTLKHTSENKRMYMYHLSDVKKHDFAFTFTGIYMSFSSFFSKTYIYAAKTSFQGGRTN